MVHSVSASHHDRNHIKMKLFMLVLVALGIAGYANCGRRYGWRRRSSCRDCSCCFDPYVNDGSCLPIYTQEDTTTACSAKGVQFTSRPLKNPLPTTCTNRCGATPSLALSTGMRSCTVAPAPAATSCNPTAVTVTSAITFAISSAPKISYFADSTKVVQTPNKFCLKYTYTLETGFILRVVLFTSVSPSFHEILGLVNSHDHHHYGSEVVAIHSTAEAVAKSVAKQFGPPGSTFHIGFILQTVTGTALTGATVTSYSVTESNLACTV